MRGLGRRAAGRLRRTWQARPAGSVTHVVTVGPGEERFLDQTLESIRRQTYRDTDELIVRWGGGQPVAGLAEARNQGLRYARGDYVRLVPCGVLVPWHSTAQLVRALRSGSATTAAGSTRRGDGWRDHAFDPAPGVDPGLGDRIVEVAGWRQSGLAFDPAHGAFGDATMAAVNQTLGCTRVEEVVAEDPGRTGLAFGHLRRWSQEADAWMAAIASGLAHGSPAWAQSVLDHRLPALLGDVEGLDAAQWDTLVPLVARLLERAAIEDHVAERVRAEARVLAWLVAHDHRDRVTALVLARWRESEDLPTVVRDGQVLADLPGADRCPAEMRMLGRAETPLVIRTVRRHADHASVVAFIRGVETGTAPTVTARFRGDDVSVRAVSDPAATRIAAEADHLHDHAWLEVDLASDSVGVLDLEYTCQGILRDGTTMLPETVEETRRRDPRPDTEVGPYAQRQLQRWYAEPHPIDPDLAYFQAYTGQAATDSPRAIHDALRRVRPDLRMRWLVEDLAVPVPEGAEPVLWRSREWYATLATARYLVTNIEMERWFRTRDSQILVQTWHGNPGKSMGHTAWAQAGLSAGRVEQALAHGSRNWRLLVSPSPEMTRHYREQFDYDGPVEDHGYPRDDALLAADAGARRHQVRRALGIGDRAAVLYAPTWRPDLATNHRRARLGDAFDLATAAEALGEQYVLLLRGHRFHRDRDLSGAQIVDVTDHPEVNDLILAADAAVLDYSSIRFDFALTGRPMIFCVPDLDAYTAGRGFLYDFADSAPGPMVTTTEAVVERLRDLDSVTASWAEERRRFHDRFNAFQDGHAAERVATRMLALADDATASATERA